MMFEVTELEIDGYGLRMSYHLSPWDDATVGAPVASISRFEVVSSGIAESEYEEFRQWCSGQKVALVSCRLPQDRLVECGFLEARGFRFIELNYRPELAGLQSAELGEPDAIRVEHASAGDESTIADIASQVFEVSRFHNDPMMPPRIGDLRYRMWVSNAFRNPRQVVLKCLLQSRIVAFFVVESPAPDQRFWSLVGLAPGLDGRGMGSQVWPAVLRWHRDEGVDRVSTSTSSLNVPVHNLYVKLGFRYPAPRITLHWCPTGPIEGPT